jgi:argininosuccinate lyase
MEQYNASLPYDRLFYAQDIAGSIAFARANFNNGILTKDEFAAIEKGFAQIKEEWASNSFEVKDNDEDIHTANERRLSEIVGKDIGGKLHTGRSRNEQVATDMRLWLREELKKLEQFLIQLIKTSVQRAEAEIDVLVSFPNTIIQCDITTVKLIRHRCPATPICRRRSQFAGHTGSSPMPQPLHRSSSVSVKSLRA